MFENFGSFFSARLIPINLADLASFGAPAFYPRDGAISPSLPIVAGTLSCTVLASCIGVQAKAVRAIVGPDIAAAAVATIVIAGRSVVYIVAPPVPFPSSYCASIGIGRCSRTGSG